MNEQGDQWDISSTSTSVDREEQEKPERPKRKIVVSPFVRLSRVHAFSAAGDAMVTVALAGSLFFNIDPSAARWRVGLYLALTIAPFAVISPLIGPIIDRYAGGRRIMIFGINLLRVIVAALMVTNLDSLFLFPLAFAILILQKSYAIAKAAVVPTTVSSNQELVEKNSRLSLLSGIAGFVGAAPAALLQWIGGPEWSVLLAAIAFFSAAVASLRLPKIKIASEPEDEKERQELRSKGIVQAASGMGVLRGMIGFFTFLVAFAYRGGTDDLDLSGTGSAIGAKLHEELLGVDLGADGASAIKLGAVIAFGVLGGLTGSAISPRLRARIDEERILLGALLTTFVAALLGLWSGGISGALLVGFAVAISANAGKQAFDSIVQRDAPDANYGRSFARFETRFQLLWVIGALIPVIFTIPARLGFLLLSIAAGFAGFSLIYGPVNRKQNPNLPDKDRRLLLERLGIGEEKPVPEQEVTSQLQGEGPEPRTSQEFFPFPEPDDPNGPPRLF